MARLTQGLTLFVHWCDKNRNMMEIRLHLHKDFLIKVIIIIDDDPNQWLSECYNAEMVMDTTSE